MGKEVLRSLSVALPHLGSNSWLVCCYTLGISNTMSLRGVEMVHPTRILFIECLYYKHIWRYIHTYTVSHLVTHLLTVLAPTWELGSISYTDETLLKGANVPQLCPALIVRGRCVQWPTDTNAFSSVQLPLWCSIHPAWGTSLLGTMVRLPQSYSSRVPTLNNNCDSSRCPFIPSECAGCDTPDLQLIPHLYDMAPFLIFAWIPVLKWVMPPRY